MALRNLLVRVGSDVSQLKKGLKEAQNSVAYFGRSVNDAMGGAKTAIAGAIAGFGAASVVGGGVQDAMKYEANMATLGESMGASRKQFEEWQETAGNAFGFSRVQGANLASLLSLNFKAIATSSEDLVNKTTKMMETAAIVANKRGMTMEEVSDRIRSAMNQEADGADELGVNVRVAAIQQSKAYQEMANGAPWDSLTENMRKTILYHHILQQVSQNLGDTLQDTTATRFAMFTASLSDVRMALGQAFLPILYNVLPLLNTMAQALYRVLQVVSAFTRALFGGFKYQKATNKETLGGVAATNKQADAVGGLGKAQDKAGKATKKAAKEAKRGIAAFDEINQLADPPDAAGAGAGAGGGGGGAGDLGGMPSMEPMDTTPFEESISALVAKFQKMLAPIKKVAKEVWSAISSFAVEKFKQISDWWTVNGAQITQALKNVWNFILPIITFVVKFVWDSIKGLISGIITFFTGLINFFSGVFTGDWKMAWEGLKDMVFGAIQAIWNFTNLTLLGGIKKIIFELVESGIKSFITFASRFKEIFGKSTGDVLKFFKDLIKNIKQFFTDFGTWMYNTGVDIAHKVIDAMAKIGGVGKTIVDTIKSAFSGIVNWFTRIIITPLINSFESIKNAFKFSIEYGLERVFNTIRSPINEMIRGLNKVKNSIPGVSAIVGDIRPLPHLAAGGIATGPTLAMVGEGRQDEAIAPLDKLQGFITNAVMNAGGGGSGDIVLNIDGRTFARIVNPHLAKENQRIGTNIRLKPI